MYALGATSFPVVTSCPHCSKLVNGTCVTCEPGEENPACEYCVNGRIRVPWYLNELFLAVVTTVAVSVASTLIISKIQSKLLR